jgi:hypothetical protein
MSLWLPVLRPPRSPLCRFAGPPSLSTPSPVAAPLGCRPLASPPSSPPLPPLVSPRAAIVVVVVAATGVARVAAARRCFSAAVARLVIRRPHTVVVACRQARRHRVVRSSVGTLPAVVLALALPSATLPRARRAAASTGRTDRARPARPRLTQRRLVSPHCRPNLLTRTARAASNLATTCPPRHEDWRILSFIRLQWSPPELLFIHRRALRMSC